MVPVDAFVLTDTPADRQTEDEDEVGGDCAGDAFAETFVISVTHGGSHAQPVNTVMYTERGEKAHTHTHKLLLQCKKSAERKTVRVSLLREQVSPAWADS